MDYALTTRSSGLMYLEGRKKCGEVPRIPGRGVGGVDNISS